MKPLFFLFVFFIAVFTANAQNIRYVKPISTGNGDGSSWANASHDLQAMMDSLKTTGGQVWVAQGTYKPLHKVADTTVVGFPTGNEHKSFVLVKDVEVYGGFQGIYSETALHHRNWHNYETILSGDIGIVGDSTDNVFHVVISAGDVGNACLDGFTVTGGCTEHENRLEYSVYVNGEFIYCNFGGGIAVYSSSPKLKNLVCKKNTANDGGAAYFYQSSSLLENTIVINNTGKATAGMTILNSSVKIINILVSNNMSVSIIYGYTSGGLSILSHDSISIIINATIVDNFAQSVVGGILIGNAKLYNSIIWNNHVNKPLSVSENIYDLVEENLPPSIYSNCIVEDVTAPGISNADPLFIDAANGNYRLNPLSPAINSGNNAFYHPDSLPNLSETTTDLDGNPRINCVVDLGAYEYQGNHAISKPVQNYAQYVCFGDSAELVFNLTGKAPWEIVYTKDNGLSHDTVSHIQTNLYRIKIYTEDTILYKIVSIRDAFCEMEIQDSVLILVIPIPAFTNNFITDTLCSGQQTKEIAFSGIFTDYIWEATGNMIDSIPQGIQTGAFEQYTLVNNTSNPLSATINITPYYQAGQAVCKGIADTFSFTVLPVPLLYTTLINDTLCSGKQTQAIDFTGMATHYQWENRGYPTTGIPTGIQTGNFGNYTLENKTNQTQEASITVIPQYRLGNKLCLGEESKFNLLVYPQTQIHNVNKNKFIYCEGELLELTAEAINVDLSYQWYHNNSLLTGAVNEYYIIPAIRKEDMGNYHVEATGICGTAKSNSINIETSSDKMLVEKWNDVILVDNSTYEYYGYQWYRDNIPIIRATNQFYQELGGLKGCYSVELTLANGQKERTCERCIDNKTGKSLSVYPNPVREGENIQIQTTEDIVSVQLYSLEGKQIRIGNPITKTLTTTGLQQGVYIISIQSKEKAMYRKQIIMY